MEALAVWLDERPTRKAVVDVNGELLNHEIIGRVPVILHTPLMSGSNFVHGIVVVRAMIALGQASTGLEKLLGFIGVVLAAGNTIGDAHHSISISCSWRSAWWRRARALPWRWIARSMTSARCSAWRCAPCAICSRQL